MAATTDRAEALRRLAELGAKPELGATADEPAVTASGDEVYAGGDVKRLLVSPAHLTYREGAEVLHAFAEVGDTVTLTAKQAKRLDDLGVTRDPKDVPAKEEAPADPDAKLKAMTAAELVAHVAQNPDDRAKVRELELARPEDKAANQGGRRSSVLEATKTDEDEDGEEFAPEDEQ